MKLYALIAVPTCGALYTIGAMANGFTWWHPFGVVLLTCLFVVGAAIAKVCALLAGQDTAERERYLARQAVSWGNLSEAEKDVILEIRKRADGRP